MTEVSEKSNLNDVWQELEKQEQIESLHYLVEKLPQFTKTVQSVEEKLAFVESVLSDKQSLSLLSKEFEEKIEQLHVNQEHFDAMLDMVHLLPSIVPVLKQGEEIASFITDVIGDEQSLDYALKGLNDVVPIEEGKAIIEETNKRFKADDSDDKVSILSMYRLLKDPTVQKGFKYIETLLDVINKR